MSRSTAGPTLVLTGAGILLGLAGIAGIAAGLFLAEPIHHLLPEQITSDAAAIGGAALALGVALLLTGLAHLVVAAALRRGAALVPGMVLCAVMAVLAVGWAVTALVAAAAGSVPVGGMLPAAVGLLVAAAAYGWSAGVLMRVRRTAMGPS